MEERLWHVLELILCIIVCTIFCEFFHGFWRKSFRQVAGFLGFGARRSGRTKKKTAIKPRRVRKPAPVSDDIEMFFE